MTRRSFAVLVPVLCSAVMTLLPPGATASARAARWWPVDGPLVRGFEPPEPNWLPGHRGVDLATEADMPVRTPRDGVVIFAGRVGGTPVLVVGHGAVRATYQPVGATVTVGSAVSAGQPIGRMAAGASHCAPSCLHWGARVADSYVDPLILLGRPHVVLLPTAD